MVRLLCVWTGSLDPEPRDGPPKRPSTGDPSCNRLQAWVVGAHDDHRLGGEGTEIANPSVLDRVELAIAIQLITEQVQHDHDIRTERIDDTAEGHLVDLEDRGTAPTVGPPAAIPDHRCDQALSQVCSGPVGDGG